MQFEQCTHNPESVDSEITIDDLGREVVNVTCTECGAEGYIVIRDSNVHWDPKTLPEWREVLSGIEAKNEEGDGSER